jgi:hypothetical protein
LISTVSPQGFNRPTEQAQKKQVAFAGLLPQLVNTYSFADTANKQAEKADEQIAQLQRELQQAQIQNMRYQALLHQQMYKPYPQIRLAGANAAMAPQRTMQAPKNQVRFGFEPFSTTWFAATIGASSINKICGYVMDDMRALSANQHRREIEEHLASAEVASTDGDKRTYLERAERGLVRLLADSSTRSGDARYIKQSHIYKELAIVAKALNRESAVVNRYVEQSMENFNNHAEMLNASQRSLNGVGFEPVK